ncbi:hypothetical protein FA95DRAFT_1492837, partial [Auriscalpium vulgare]
DAAVARAEEAEGKNKKLEQLLLEKEQEVQSLSHRLTQTQDSLDKTEEELKDAKRGSEEVGSQRTTNEALQRKVQLLEEELDAAEKNVKETVEKLRQVDVKAEHFERQVQRVEQERDGWEKKYEDAEAKFRKSQGELDDLVKSMESI